MTNFPYAQARTDYEQASMLGVARTSNLEAGDLCREESGENEGLLLWRGPGIRNLHLPPWE